MNDLLMTEDGDLYVAGNDIRTTDSIRQGILIRLRWWYKEWMFGPGYGVKYYENVFVKNPNQVLICSEITSQILDVDGVASVEDVTIRIDNQTREAVIAYKAVTVSKERLEGEVRLWNTA